MTYTIDNETNKITTDVTTNDAAGSNTAETFTSEAELSELAANWPGARLIAIWNAIPGVTPVKKFKDRPTGVARIWKAIQPSQEAAVPEALAEPENGPLAAPATEVTIERLADSVEPEVATETEFEPSTKPEPTVAPEPTQTPDVAPEEAPATTKATRAKKAPKAAKEPKRSNVGSKTANVLDLMQREGGASLAEIMEATNWQAHSVRGFISGTLTKKMGLVVISAKGEDGVRRYSIKA